MKIEMIRRENSKPERRELMLLTGKLVVPAANIRAIIESATTTTIVKVGVVLSWLFVFSSLQISPLRNIIQAVGESGHFFSFKLFFSSSVIFIYRSNALSLLSNSGVILLFLSSRASFFNVFFIIYNLLQTLPFLNKTSINATTALNSGAANLPFNIGLRQEDIKTNSWLCILLACKL